MKKDKRIYWIFTAIAGAVAILSGLSPRVKEWAYAGFAFDLLGASASHFFAGDKTEPFIPLAFLLLMSVSYAYWHRLEEGAREVMESGR